MSDALTIAVSVVAIGCAGLILVGLLLRRDIRRGNQAIEIAFRGFNETNRLGFELMQISLERLERRVKTLEGEPR